MKLSRLFALLLALMLCMGCIAQAEADDKAPDITVVDADGNEVKLSDCLTGLPVVMNVWASWCPPCVAELEHFEKAVQEYEGRLAFMMVNLTDGEYETVEGAKAFIDQNGYTFPLYFDVLGEVSGTYVGQYIPITWFFNADGTVLGYYEGGMDEDTLQYCLNLLLEGE